MSLPSRKVTPSEPLNITTAVPGFDTITLEGGVVTITARNTFPIAKLIQKGTAADDASEEVTG